MSVKNLHYLLIAMLGFATTSCEKVPSTSELHQEYLVYTASDPKTNFADLGNFYLPDSILLIGKPDKIEYWKDADANLVVKSMADNMTARNFTRTDDKAGAKLGIQMSYVKDVTYFVGHNDPYWWWYYPYYWAPSYWGDWLGWHYPYPVAYYAYTSGSLLVEVVDLTAESEGPKKLPVVWNIYIGGLLTDSNKVNIERTISGVDQAFVQSPNVKK